MIYRSLVLTLALLNVVSVTDAVEARGPDHLDKGDNLIFVHIPKTAGMSFRFTTNDAGDFDTPHTEKCFTELVEQYGQAHPHDGYPFVSTFLRAPRAHVLSEFLECKYDNWGKRVTKGTSFPRGHSDKDDFAKWVNHFYDSWNKEDDSSKREMTLESYHCYHPYNLQARQLSDNCRTSHYLEPGEAQSVTDMKSNAVRNLNTAQFVGIVELYDASMCLFWMKSGQKDNVNQFCNKEKLLETKEGESEVTHHVPEHHLIDMKKSTLDKVDELTKFDSLLYYNGLLKFIRDFDDERLKYDDISLSSFPGNLQPLYDTIDRLPDFFPEKEFKYIKWIKDKLADVKDVPRRL